MTKETATDLSPWAHPKAKRWFESLFEDSSFPLALDDEIAKAENQNDFEKIRVILALALLVGRPGMWPESRNGLLRAAVRAAHHVSSTTPGQKEGRAMTIAEAKGRTADHEAIRHEIELMRRRLKMSNRKSEIYPPMTWGNIWE
jgi:hypothetical protein